MRYNYIAKDKQGKSYSGNFEATDVKEARAKLQKLGLFVVTLKTANNLRQAKTKIKPAELIVFTERLSVMVGAGLPVIKSLKTIADQTENDAFKQVLSAINFDLESGSTFSGALSKYPDIFSNLYINLIKAGETGGIIAKVLERIAIYLEKENHLRQSLIKAFSYPAIVGLVAVFIVTFLVVFIVPVFAKTYATMGLNLPIPTLVLIGLSQLITHYWWLLLAIIIGTTAGYKALIKNPIVQVALDKFKLKLIIFGELNRKVIIARFVRTFGLLLASGIPVVSALEVIRTISGNKLLDSVIERIKNEITKGIKLGAVIVKENIFTPMVVQMISSGEEAGNLPLMLTKTADFLERDVDQTVEKLVVRLEPLLTFALALVVGFIALAIYLPMFDLISKVAQK